MSRPHRTPPRSNTNLDAKLAVRRRVLAAAGFPELFVWDLCAGEGLLWKQLRSDAEAPRVAAYTPCDLRPRFPGTIKGDLRTSFLDGFDVAQFNVIDIDPFGSPWDAWLRLVPKISRRTVAFFTHGYTSGRTGVNLSNAAKEALGIPLDWKIPQTQALVRWAGRTLLDQTARTLPVEGCWEAGHAMATYYGIICGEDT